jgi:hypothetical protein
VQLPLVEKNPMSAAEPSSPVKANVLAAGSNAAPVIAGNVGAKIVGFVHRPLVTVPLLEMFAVMRAGSCENPSTPAASMNRPPLEVVKLNSDGAITFAEPSLNVPACASVPASL